MDITSDFSFFFKVEIVTWNARVQSAPSAVQGETVKLNAELITVIWDVVEDGVIWNAKEKGALQDAVEAIAKI